MSSYKKLYSSGELARRVKKAYQILQECTFCPHECQVDRLQDETGRCGLGKQVKIASFGLHHGEERALSGSEGSGTIFFSGCSLRCVFCQNYDISQQKQGNLTTIPQLAEIMLNLQKRGGHNINLVTPSHFIYHILAALYLASAQGLNIPLVYNTSGYDSPESLTLLDGVVDIYLPDFKYGDDELGAKYSGVPDYFSTASRAIKEMHDQVGLLERNSRGMAKQGLMIRHLVLPENQAATPKVLKFIAKKIHPDTYINIMEQYYPSYHASRFEKIQQSLSKSEFQDVLKEAQKCGLIN
ncbi:MAG: radical SAM protein [Bacillota bacterium]